MNQSNQQNNAKDVDKLETKERPAKKILILGAPYSGKTTLVEKLASKTSHSRVLIITPHECEWSQVPSVDIYSNMLNKFTGIRKNLFDGRKSEFLERIDKLRNCLLVFDDCRAFIDAKLDYQLHSLLISTRQRMIDLVACAHGFTEMPPKFFTFATEIILYKTLDNIAKRKDVLLNYEQMKEAQKRVNQKAIQNQHYFEIIKMI